MYTPGNLELEKGMQITYDSLLEELKSQKQKAVERKAKLQVDATQLIKELKNSLYLPDDKYIDADGRKHHYVETYVKNAQGLYEERPTYGLQTDNLHVLKFTIGVLMVGDGDELSMCYLPVEMFYMRNNLNVVSGDERSYVVVADGQEQSRFYEAATLLKTSLLKKIKDPNL